MVHVISARLSYEEANETSTELYLIPATDEYNNFHNNIEISRTGWQALLLL